MIGIVDLPRAEADLAAGELACTGCGGRLHRWGHARADREVLATLATESTRLGEALTALAVAAVTVRARLAPHVPPWTLIGQFTHGRLVTPAGTG
jgi:hypothetical protein